MALPTIVYLAIDAGGTFLKSAVLNAEGEVLQGSDFSIKSVSEGSREQILHAFCEIVTKGLEFIRERVMKLEGIGIAFPGPFDIYKATSLMKHKFQGIYGLNMRKWFYGISGVPDEIPIKFIHDANAVLSGEIWKGYARGFRNAAVVTLGTGLGFAISEDGKVLCNDIGGPLISIYNRPYRNGNLENYTAKRGFLKIYRDLSGKAEVDGIEVADIGKWADHGDEISIQTFNEVGQILAQSLQEILTLRNIECLLFSGQISRSFHHLEPSLKEGLKNIECLSRISVVQSIENAALLGALHNLRSNE